MRSDGSEWSSDVPLDRVPSNVSTGSYVYEEDDDYEEEEYHEYEEDDEEGEDGGQMQV